MISPFIPFLDLRAGNEVVRKELDRAWRDVLGHGRFTGGPEVEIFESEFAEYCDSAHCIGVGNGTDALELILAALGIGPGDEVIVPGNTFVATAEAICAAGAFPRFVDVRPTTLEIDPDAVEEAINPRTVAIIAVHLYGQMAEVDRLESIAARHGLVLLEDAAQAHGARFGGRRAGSIGRAAAFSFYPAKNLGALGDGGAVLTDDDEIASRVRQLANHGRARESHWVHDVSGRNSRLDTLQAAVLSVKLPKLDEQNHKRRVLMQHYREQLPRRCMPLAQHGLAESVHHLAVVQVRDRAAATHVMSVAGIGWGLHYPVPCYRQPAFAEFVDEKLPVTDRAAERILSLPLSPTMTVAQVDRVCQVLSRLRGRS
ncbi:DegT/DnrJ/EryC1/StrS family aminotransferase [Petropleomorpha daqingensis]|uniref:dTDP-4-amino-4,6-dideoxygalactose transaminase n=1 Tax=Petropleomorpha daqingensis TaxID=2026353 RepID=A0A853CH83_9ACTN|nr:DegT/DnrJ/EryC1/StrS family aminotransferase [Petropleomorpha daqingensis]NYJ05902.1 dTDP-4-amino-4,6-dideoxygalactose transaminase [Petropleomorpha daqingensis]